MDSLCGNYVIYAYDDSENKIIEETLHHFKIKFNIQKELHMTEYLISCGNNLYERLIKKLNDYCIKIYVRK
jgi:hypothetical protein